MRYLDWLLPVGLALLLAGIGFLSWAVLSGPFWLLWPGVAAVLLSIGAYAVATWRAHRRVDWQRIQAEQRLWESGPVGRLWLKYRKTYAGRR